MFVRKYQKDNQFSLATVAINFFYLSFAGINFRVRNPYTYDYWILLLSCFFVAVQSNLVSSLSSQGSQILY